MLPRRHKSRKAQRTKRRKAKRVPREFYMRLTKPLEMILEVNWKDYGHQGVTQVNYCPIRKPDTKGPYEIIKVREVLPKRRKRRIS